MSTKQRILAWWHGLEGRERAMLAVMALLLAAFAWWYGLLWPLRALRDGAQAHHDRAAAALHGVRAEAASLAASAAAATPPATPEALQQRILDSARDAGLTPSRQRSAADGGFVVEFDRVGSPGLFGWLGGLAERDGIAPSSLHVQRADGGLRVEAGFGGAAP